MPPPNFADSTLPFGSKELTVLETGTEYVADNIDIKTNTKVLKRPGKKGATAAKRVINMDVSGSVDLQLAEESTIPPVPRYTFGADLDNDGNTEGYQFSDVGNTFQIEDVFKCKASIEGCVAPLIYIPATTRAPADMEHVEDGAITSVTLGAYLPKDMSLATNPWSATGLPTGISIDAATGALSGTPTTVGVYNVVVKCAGEITIEGETETRYGVRKWTWEIVSA